METKKTTTEAGAKTSAHKNRNVRTFMVIFSLMLGVAAAIAVSSTMRDLQVGIGQTAIVFVITVLIVCAPALFHKFVLPEPLGIKDRFLLAAYYLLFWAVAPMAVFVFISVTPGWTSGALMVLAAITAVCYGLGKLLRK